MRVGGADSDGGRGGHSGAWECRRWTWSKRVRGQVTPCWRSSRPPGWPTYSGTQCAVLGDILLLRSALGVIVQAVADTGRGAARCGGQACPSAAPLAWPRAASGGGLPHCLRQMLRPSLRAQRRSLAEGWVSQDLGSCTAGGGLCPPLRGSLHPWAPVLSQRVHPLISAHAWHRLGSQVLGAPTHRCAPRCRPLAPWLPQFPYL